MWLVLGDTALTEFFIGLLVLGEATAGILVLSGGRRMEVGLALLLAFHVGLLFRLVAGGCGCIPCRCSARASGDPPTVGDAPGSAHAVQVLERELVECLERHPAATDEDTGGVWASAAACMRNYLILREESRAFRADPRPFATCASTSSPCQRWQPVRAWPTLRAESFDPEEVSKSLGPS